MAIAYVRDTGLVQTPSSGTSNASFGTLPKVGNHVIATVGSWANAGDAATFTDNQTGNSWQTDAEELTPASGQASAHIGSTKVLGSAGTFTVTCTFVNNNHFFTWAATEFSGLAPSNWFDQKGVATANSGAGTTVTATGANTLANELVVSVICDTSSGSTNVHISDPPSGFTHIYAQQSNSGSNIAAAGAYKTVSAIETSSCAWTYDTIVSEGICTALATYKAAVVSWVSTATVNGPQGGGTFTSQAQTHVAGNLLVAVTYHQDFGDNIASVTNTAGDTWCRTRSAKFSKNFGGSDRAVEIWYTATSSAFGSTPTGTIGAVNDVVSVNSNAGNSYTGVDVYEFAKIGGVWRLIGDSADGDGASSVTTQTTGSFTLTGDSAIAAFLYLNNGGVSPIAGSGFNIINTSGGGFIFSEYAIASASGAASTTTGSAVQYVMLGAAFDNQGSGGASQVPYQPQYLAAPVMAQ